MSKYYYQILGRVLPQILSVLIQSLFLKYIGIDNVSNFGIILFYYTIVYSIMSGGIDTIFLKMHDNSMLNYIIVYKVISHLLILLPIVFFLYQLYAFEIYTIICLTFGFLLQSIIESILLAFRIVEKDIHTLYPKIIQLLIIGLLLILFEPNTLLAYSLIYLFSWLVIFILIYYVVSLNISLEYSFISFKNFVKSYWKEGSYLGLTILITQILSNIDFIFLEYFKDSIIAGNYKLSLMLSQSFIPIIGAITTIYMSNLSKIDFSLKSINMNILQSIINRQIILIIFVSSFFLVSSIFIFDLMYQFLFKEADSSFLYVSVILIFSSIFNAFSMLWSYLLVKLNMERIILNTMIHVVFGSLLINVILIYYYGVNGAIFGNILSQLVLFIVLRYKTKNILRKFECVE